MIIREVKETQMVPRSGEAKSSLDEIRERGRIRIATTWGPTAEMYLDPETGEPAGVVGLVGRVLADDLGVEPEFVDLTWGEQMPALLDGRVDICLKHTNRPDRAFLVDFATGRLERYEGKIVIRHDSSIRQEEDLNYLGRLIAAEIGSHQEAQVRERYPNARLRTCHDAHEAMHLVLHGEADACLADAGVPEFLSLHAELSVLCGPDSQPVITSLDYAHPCIRAGDQRFLNWLNNWMDYHTVQGAFQRCIDRAYQEHQAKFARIMAKHA